MQIPKKVKDFIDSTGYTLISQIFWNVSTKLKLMCENGHIVEKTYADFKKTQFCKECNNKKIFSDDDRYKYIELKGYSVINYSRTLLQLKCEKNHIFDISWRSFYTHNKRCPVCVETKKTTYEFIKNNIESVGYKLLSTSYVNSESMLEILCERHHRCDKSWTAFYHSNNRCKICYSLDRKLNLARKLISYRK